MASLIENLIIELNEEYPIYEELLSVAQEKTTAIVSNDLDRLRDVTSKEQFMVDTITGMEGRRRETMANIASVLGKRAAEVKVVDVIGFLENQPEFSEPLMEINEKLGKLAHRLKEVNSHNQNLIKESLSMIEFNIALMQNLNRAPETAEYSKDMFKGKGAGNYGGIPGEAAAGKFDTKQ